MENGFVRVGKEREVDNTELQGIVHKVLYTHFQVWFPLNMGKFFILLGFYL